MSQRLQSIMDERKAQLWINHDKPQSDGLPLRARVLRMRRARTTTEARPAG